MGPSLGPRCMKILYIANDRRAAELAAFALRTVAPDVAVAWAASLGNARRWIDENRDVATLIVEVGSDSPSFESFVGQVRGLGVTAPVIVVSVKDPAPPLTALEAVADEIVTKDLSFLNDLPDIVRRTLHTARPAARPARRRLRLLYVGDAALARECLGRPGGSIEVVGAVPGLSGKFDPLPTDVRPGVPPPFAILLIEHGYPGVETLAILKDMAARKPHVPVVIVAEWDEELAVLALELGAHDYVVKSKASFRAVYFRLNRLIAHSALLNEQSSLRDAHAATIDQERATREDLIRRLAEAQTACTNVEQQLNDAVAAIRQARQDRFADAVVAAGHHAQRESDFAARLAEATAARQKLEQQLADAQLGLQRAEERHTSEMTAAAARLAEYRKQAETQMAQAAADAAAAFQTAEQQAAAERQAAAEQAAQRQATLETELRQEVARRQAVEKEFADTRAASEQAQLRFLDEVAATGQRAREHETRLEERAARERAEWETARVEGQGRVRHLQMEGDLARESLVATEEQIQRLESAHEEERADFERALMATEADLARQRAEYTALQQTLDETRATAQETLERVSNDRATERARLEALVAERDTRLQEQAALKQASDEAAARTLADLEHRLRLTLAAGNRDSRAIAQLQEQLEALGEELEATRSQREILKTAADRVPQLRQQIDDIREENRRQFDHTPVNMCRCSRDGAVTQVNHALAGFLGYGTPEEVQKVDFAGTVFESGDELQWIVDRCLASRSTESVETTWRRKDSSRVIVRVLAVATTADSIDLAAQDITTFRELEEKLRNSQRMEAVARYGSEVAVTCHNLLRHVKQEGQQWLARIDSDTARYQGGLLLDEVTRAAGFLRQLAVYGNEQKNAPELVNVNKVLRDLEPVLKRVAGGNIEIVLPQASTPLNLDVEAERVERILVNVAAYGRERMPLGGRLMIEVASVVVDRTFVAKYPNVRPGAHVLLTVNEVRGAVRPDFSAAISTQASGANATAPASNNPGVDLGALQALVSDCGGHLWMMAEPPGDMVLKIHLPRRVLDRPDPRAQAKRPGRARWINRAFGARH